MVKKKKGRGNEKKLRTIGEMCLGSTLILKRKQDQNLPADANCPELSYDIDLLTHLFHFTVIPRALCLEFHQEGQNYGHCVKIKQADKFFFHLSLLSCVRSMLASKKHTRSTVGCKMMMNM